MVGTTLAPFSLKHHGIEVWAAEKLANLQLNLGYSGAVTPSVLPRLTHAGALNHAHSAHSGIRRSVFLRTKGEMTGAIVRPVPITTVGRRMPAHDACKAFFSSDLWWTI